MEHITRHFGAEVGPYIVTAQITALPLQTLLERNRIEGIDLLHIDTEGTDWTILRQLDLQRYAPKVIFVEHCHLTPEEKIEIRQFLQNNYQILDLGYDYFCQRVSAVP